MIKKGRRDMLVTPKQMQELERITDESGISYEEMMERAGYKLAEYIVKHSKRDDQIVFLAGNGNNGGDCYVAAYYLRPVRNRIAILAPIGEPKTEIARDARNRAVNSGIQVYAGPGKFLTLADVVIDGIFGTGFRGELPKELQEILKPRSNQFRIACDIPSGGNGRTGQVSEGTFRADITVTFGVEKLGMSQYPLRGYCGEIHIADIGIPEGAGQKVGAIERLTLERVQKNLPVRKPEAYKNQFGHILAVAGSVRMRGACILAVTAAMRSGAGLLTCASVKEVLTSLVSNIPECMCLPLMGDVYGFLADKENHEILSEALKNKQALLLGCGMGVTESTEKLIKYLISESSCPIILDADGLNCMVDSIDCIPEGRPIITPHAGEAARLLKTEVSEIQKDRITAAYRLAELTKSIVVLKGAGTVITDGYRTAVCNLGNPGMARAGSGDVLTGIISALVAQGLELYEAACTGVTIHAAAGDKAAERLPERYMLPQDLIRSLQEIL